MFLLWILACLPFVANSSDALYESPKDLEFDPEMKLIGLNDCNNKKLMEFPSEFHWVAKNKFPDDFVIGKVLQKGTIGNVWTLEGHIDEEWVLKVSKKRNCSTMDDAVQGTKGYVEAEAIVQSRIYSLIEKDRTRKERKYPNIMVPEVSTELVFFADTQFGIRMERVHGSELFDVLKARIMTSEREDFLKNKFPIQLVDFILDVDESDIPNLPDIKAENVMLTEDDVAAYFIDFDLKCGTVGICPPSQIGQMSTFEINNFKLPASKCNQLIGAKYLLISVCMRVHGGVPQFEEFDLIYFRYANHEISTKRQPKHHVKYVKKYEKKCLQNAPETSNFHQAFEKLNKRIAENEEVSHYSNLNKSESELCNIM